MRKNGIDVEDHIGFARSLARRFARSLPPGVGVDDLEQEAALALILAPETYDPKRGRPFRSYLFQRTRGALLDWCRSEDPLARSRKGRFNYFGRIRRDLEQRLGRRADEEEIATSGGVTLANYQSLRDSAVVWRGPIDDDRLRDPAETDLFDPVYSDRMVAALGKELARLPKRTRAILGSYYVQEMTFAEIAGEIDLSESETARIHAKTISLLRAKLASERIRESE